jgi:hypothetical protein
MVYGSALPTLTASYGGFVNGDTPASLTAVPILTTAATAGSPVGSYAITAGGAASGNYTISYLPGSLTVTPAPLTIAVPATTQVQGSPAPIPTPIITGLVNGDTAAMFLPQLVLTPSTTIDSAVGGNYVITVTGAKNPNYTITYVPGPLTVVPRPAIATPTFDFVAGQTITYGAATVVVSGHLSANAGTTRIPAGEPVFVTLNGVTVQAQLDAANRYAATFDTHLLPVSGSPYSVTMAYHGDGTFGGSMSGTSLTVKKAPVTIRLAPPPGVLLGPDTLRIGLDEWTAPQTFHAVPIAVLGVNGDDLVAAYPGFLGRQFSTGTAPMAPGTYTVTASFPETQNYLARQRTFTLVIGTAASLDPVAAQTITYGTAAVTVAGHLSTGGLAVPAGEAVSVTLNGVTQLAALDPAGHYATTFDTAALSAAGSPYTVALAYAGDVTLAAATGSTTLTVNRAPLTVTVDDDPATARQDAYTRAYGDPNPVLAVRYDGFVRGESAAALGGALQFNLAATPASGVGTYPVTADGLTTANYAITFVPGSLVVRPRPVKVTANAVVKTFGDPDPSSTLVYAVAGSLANGDAFTGSIVRDAGETAGIYAIRQGWLALTSNYALTFVPGTLTINKAPVAVTVAGGAFLDNGLPHAGSGAVTGAGGLSVPATLSYYLASDTALASPLTAAPAAAGNYVVVARYAGDANHLPGASAPAALTISPKLVGLARLDAATTNLAAVRYLLTFSAPVTGLTTGNFELTASGLTGASVAQPATSDGGRTWTVTVATGTGDGTVSLRLANTTGLAGPGGVAVATQTTSPVAYAIDKTAPRAAQVLVTYGNGRTFDLATLGTRQSLPWQITGIRVVFTEPVTAGAGALALTGRAGILAIRPVEGNGTTVLTWTLQTPITLDQVTAALSTAGGIADAAGNALAGSSTSFGFAVVYGDVNGDGQVTSNEPLLVSRALGPVTPATWFYDVNGDGVVSTADVLVVRTRVGSRLA